MDPVASDLHQGPLASFARRSQTVPWNGPLGVPEVDADGLVYGIYVDIYIYISRKWDISDPENDISSLGCVCLFDNGRSPENDQFKEGK